MQRSSMYVLHIPIFAVMMLLSLWLAIGYSVSQAYSIATHNLAAPHFSDVSSKQLGESRIQFARDIVNLDRNSLQNVGQNEGQNVEMYMGTQSHPQWDWQQVDTVAARINTKGSLTSAPISITLQPAPSEMLATHFQLSGRGRQLQVGPAIIVTKTVGLSSDCAPTDLLVISEPTEVFYCYIVFNVGSTAAITHTVIDDKIGILLEDTKYPLNPNSGIDSGAYFTLPVIVEETVKNIVTWHSIDEEQTDMTTTADALVVIPTIVLTTTLSDEPNKCGQQHILSTYPSTTISVCYTVKNTSPITLAKHTLEDSSIGLLFQEDDSPLGPDEIRSVMRTMVATQTTTSVITWTAKSESAVMVSAVDEVIVQIPSVELQATVGTGMTDCPVTKSITVTIDTSVTLCYLVVNTGGHMLDKHAISDTLYTYSPFTASLLPGKSMGVTITFPVTETINGVGEWRASGPEGLLAVARDTFSVALRTDATVEVFVFYDVDGEGFFNVMEPGLPNVEITLMSPRQRIYTVTTNSNGIARLEGLPETGNFTPTVNMQTVPAGYQQSTDPRGIMVERGRVVTQQLGFVAPPGTDKDEDTITDKEEGSYDYDDDGIPNYKDLDSDDDGLPDEVEGNTDTNNDGRPNRLDVTQYHFLPMISKELQISRKLFSGYLYDLLAADSPRVSTVGRMTPPKGGT